MEYLVVFEKSKTGYGAYVPDLPGCIATGNTKAVVKKRIKEAIEFHIEGLRLLHKRVPKNKAEAEFVELRTTS